MKKYNLMLSCIAVAAIVTFVGIKSLHTSGSKNISLLMANVEALSQDEGTPRAQCYRHADAGDYKSVYECDSRTNPTTMYPCPPTERYMILGVSDWCLLQ